MLSDITERLWYFSCKCKFKRCCMCLFTTEQQHWTSGHSRKISIPDSRVSLLVVKICQKKGDALKIFSRLPWIACRSPQLPADWSDSPATRWVQSAQIPWVQNKPKSSAFQHFAWQLVGGVRSWYDDICLGSTKWVAVHCSQTSPIWSHLVKEHCFWNFAVCTNILRAAMFF